MKVPQPTSATPTSSPAQGAEPRCPRVERRIASMSGSVAHGFLAMRRSRVSAEPWNSPPRSDGQRADFHAIDKNPLTTETVRPALAQNVRPAKNNGHVRRRAWHVQVSVDEVKTLTLEQIDDLYRLDVI